jgi:hypothetical protein
MALELNGTTGVNLIQDGVVTAADLASTLDLTGKTVSLAAGGTGYGKVLQVVQAIYTPGNISTTSTSWTDSGLSAISITPSSTSSKIFIGYYMIGGHANNNGAGNLGSFYSIFRDINGGGYTNLGDSNGGMLSTIVSNSALVFQNPVDLVWVDSPNTTSVCNYKAYYKIYSTSGYFSHQNYGQNKILGLAMEIAA